MKEVLLFGLDALRVHFYGLHGGGDELRLYFLCFGISDHRPRRHEYMHRESALLGVAMAERVVSLSSIVIVFVLYSTSNAQYYVVEDNILLSIACLYRVLDLESRFRPRYLAQGLIGKNLILRHSRLPFFFLSTLLCFAPGLLLGLSPSLCTFYLLLAHPFLSPPLFISLVVVHIIPVET